MKNIGVIIALSVFGVVCIILGSTWMSAHNREVSLRNTITAKQKDNTSEFDNMWKKITQVAQVSEKHKDALIELFVRHAEARSMDGGGLAVWIKESVPNADLKTFDNLQNIIVSSRDRWTMRQKELLNLKRAHDNVIDRFPSNIFVGGRGKIDVTIVTSTRTDEAFKSGKDDDVSLFSNSNKAEKEK